MREKDLSLFDVRTDLILDDTIDENTLQLMNYKRRDINKEVVVEEFFIDKDKKLDYHRAPGYYKSVSFKDITDSTNFKVVEEAFTDELLSLFKDMEIDDEMSCLVIGLGNYKSTPDALGPKVAQKIIVTHHLLSFGSLEEGYRDTFSLVPGVTGSTGIETHAIILGVLEQIKPDFVIVVDALKTTKTSRMNQIIQISNSGIAPGSGVGNNRVLLSQESLSIPIISIGVPTIIESVTIVMDTLSYIMKKIGYEKENMNHSLNKMKISRDYEYYNGTLTDDEKNKILGLVGTLDDSSLRQFILEVLNPLDYNFMVTPKEIDFLIDRMAFLLSQGINKALHKIKRQN